MSVWLIVVLVVVALLVLLEFKTSRPDGVYMAKIHHYRKLLGFIMPTRNESVVYFDDYVDVSELLKYIDDAKGAFGPDFTHCLVGAFFHGLSENPAMNRFSVGRRLYERKGKFITFSMKRQRMNRKAKLSAVKKELEPGMTFKQLVESVHGSIKVERSGKKTYQDKELNLLQILPRPALRLFIGLARWLNYYNLLPAGFIKGDAMFTSIFVANLGSVKMRAGYHHLYEWGTCPLFIMAGRIEERPVVVDGEIVARKILHLRFSYDERIDDGLTAGDGINSTRKALENPYKYLGCLKDDGSDHRPLDLTDEAEAEAAA